MAMNKTEKAKLDRLEKELAETKALSWPSYAVPPFPTYSEWEAVVAASPHGWVRAWRAGEKLIYPGYVKYASFGKHLYHGAHEPHELSSGQPGPGGMYFRRVDALKAHRVLATQEAARVLALIDSLILAEGGDNVGDLQSSGAVPSEPAGGARRSQP